MALCSVRSTKALPQSRSSKKEGYGQVGGLRQAPRKPVRQKRDPGRGDCSLVTVQSGRPELQQREELTVRRGAAPWGQARTMEDSGGRACSE